MHGEMSITLKGVKGKLPIFLELSLRERLSTFIYGLPGSGKTIVASAIALEALRLGLNPLYIYVGSHNSPLSDVDSVEAFTMDDILGKVLAAAFKGRYVIVDPINSLYSSDPKLASTVVPAIMSLLRRVGGLTIGVVREFGGSLSTPGHRLIFAYTHVIAYTSKEGDSFRLRFVKPGSRVAAFRLRGGMLEWL